jgi:hypothetical protein
MKRITLTFALPILAVAISAAQVTPIRFAAPVNPIAGLPRLLPSPMTGPLVGTGITLPNLVPALTPSLTLASAAPIASYILPVSMPARDGQIPATPAQSSRDGVVNPLRRVMPGVVIRFNDPSGAAAKPASALPDSSSPKKKLDEEFDGEGAPSKPAVQLPRRKPVTSGRHISLPEWDLERELGI